MTTPNTEPLCPMDGSPLSRRDDGWGDPRDYWCDMHYHTVSFTAAHDLHPSLEEVER